jgi:hypothetical protein
VWDTSLVVITALGVVITLFGLAAVIYLLRDGD